MKINQLIINNYRQFRGIFESEAEASAVTENLRKEILRDISSDTSPHIELQYWPHYDDEGIAGFEIVSVSFAHDRAYVHVKFISTGK